MMGKPKIIYVFAFNSSFIRKDRELLESKFDLIPLFFNPLPRWKTPFSLLKQLFQLLFHIRNCKAIVCQFAGFHTVIPVLIGKLSNTKTSIILLGAECHNYPGIQHGNFRKKALAWATTVSFENADQLLPIDQSLVSFDNTYDETEPLSQGFRGIHPTLKTNFQVIPHGFNSLIFKPNDEFSAPYTFITVSTSVAPPVYQRKGIDLILKTAPLFPHCTFTILCKNDYLVEAELPANVKLLQAVPYEKLPEILAKNRFYLQVSIAEGLPNALCEAMLCGCVPIGSNVFAIPEIIGNTGFIVPKRSVENLAEQIQLALQHTDQESLSKAARTRIIEKFPLESREISLIKAIQK
jgi:glycosyltransferase involved in cell wall biosynthesis